LEITVQPGYYGVLKKETPMKPPFTKKLLKWNTVSNTREMPWKGERDPYRIWLSEIILQQTRVDQGLKYYNKFIEFYPTVQQLAAAPDQEVFKLWEGLGYYSRCKNLLATARYITTDLNGKFPDTYENILALKGIGSYTASAIASFAYNLPYAVLDGNVFRVLSRYFGITTPIDAEDGKKLYQQLAEALLDEKQPGKYNQAIMDFGAVICKPQLPLCVTCPQKKDCEAFKNKWVSQLPVKKKPAARKTRWFYYFLVESNNRFFIKKRDDKDIWQNLYEFYLQEHSSALNLESPVQLRQELEAITGNEMFTVKRISQEYSQQLTHQNIRGRFVHIQVSSIDKLYEKGFQSVSPQDIGNYPFPKFITRFLNENPVVE
jgi:A/G-specific adenine glycosylase